MRKKISILLIVMISALMLCLPIYAHPGGTDENGGHHNRSTGEYHYHHGYPEHQHIEGECPYDFDDKTGVNSVGSTSSLISTPKPTSPPVPTNEIIREENNTVHWGLYFFCGIFVLLIVLSFLATIYTSFRDLITKKHTTRVKTNNNMNDAVNTNNYSTSHRSPKKIIVCLVVACIILSVSTGVLISVSFYLYNKNTELEHDIDTLKDKNIDLRKDLAAQKSNNKYTEYILSYEEDSSFGSFSSYTNVVILEKGDVFTSTLLCEYDTTVYSETDNSNITITFAEEWEDDTVEYTIYAQNTGCTKITFSNDYNNLKDSVLVIIK